MVKGPSSFEKLRTVDNVLCDSFKEACIASGYLEDDDEWKRCLQEASTFRNGTQLRSLFCMILLQYFPSNPLELWNMFSADICDDLSYNLRTIFNIPHTSDDDIIDYCLFLLDQKLKEFGKDLTDYQNMPTPSRRWAAVSSNPLIAEHRRLKFEALQGDPNSYINRLNTYQLDAFHMITSSVSERQDKVFFVNGGAGTGKTFLYNTTAKKQRSLGHIVIAVASSGIASLLLTGGHTAHSTFSIPFDVHDNSVCSITRQSLKSSLIRETKLIIWDEVPMQHKYCIEATDRTLRDIRDTDKPFGGITVVFGGDFRQTLPVVHRGTRKDIVGASLKRSNLWRHVNIITLHLNMRLDRSILANVAYADFLSEVGSSDSGIIHIPASIHICKDIKELILRIYPSLHIPEVSTQDYLNERIILSARNEDVHSINSLALGIMTGQPHTYLVADKMSKEHQQDGSLTNQYPIEYLNSLNPTGLPPFKLTLKKGCPIMLICNISPRNGLCNGTRMMVERCDKHVIEAKILNGPYAGNREFIPRISLTPSTSEIPFQMTRRQFPVRLAYAMKITKAQGQSDNYVGIDFRTSLFSHGQVYVALSRATSLNRISVVLPEGHINSTENIVYSEVLLQPVVPT